MHIETCADTQTSIEWPYCSFPTLCQQESNIVKYVEHSGIVCHTMTIPQGHILALWLGEMKSIWFQMKLVGQDMNIWIFTPAIKALVIADCIVPFYSWVSLYIMHWIWVGVNLGCIDACAVLEWTNSTKLHIFTAKYKANTYEHLI